MGETVLSQPYRYQKNILQCLIIFCKNEACVNCGTLNTTTLIWLLTTIYVELLFQITNYKASQFPHLNKQYLT